MEAPVTTSAFVPYFQKPKLPAKRCAVCRFYVPLSLTRGECRLNAPLGETSAERAKWTMTEPMLNCPAFSRLRLATSARDFGSDEARGHPRADAPF